ncbi:unnamed protein product [Nesidiocoris tenuis]|uniref:Uncharacterized protein n=1 Tax=Nesidiocoris tenuis TaxID=355587 RepID=A0A6H5H3T3_9HEMI|nr:unnamed protein product [Nesidiocoris tenuis]
METFRASRSATPPSAHGMQPEDIGQRGATWLNANRSFAPLKRPALRIRRGSIRSKMQWSAMHERGPARILRRRINRSGIFEDQFEFECQHQFEDQFGFEFELDYQCQFEFVYQHQFEFHFGTQFQDDCFCIFTFSSFVRLKGVSRLYFFVKIIFYNTKCYLRAKMVPPTFSASAALGNAPVSLMSALSYGIGIHAIGWNTISSKLMKLSEWNLKYFFQKCKYLLKKTVSLNLRHRTTAHFAKEKLQFHLPPSGTFAILTTQAAHILFNNLRPSSKRNATRTFSYRRTTTRSHVMAVSAFTQTKMTPPVRSSSDWTVGGFSDMNVINMNASHCSFDMTVGRSRHSQATVRIPLTGNCECTRGPFVSEHVQLTCHSEDDRHETGGLAGRRNPRLLPLADPSPSFSIQDGQWGNDTSQVPNYGTLPYPSQPPTARLADSPHYVHAALIFFLPALIFNASR